MPITGTPERIGAAIVVADSDALALLSPDGLTIGTRVFNEDVEHYFRLTKSAQTPITIAPTTDGYDDPQWTFAAATFTGFEGCTLQIVLQAPNEAFNGSFVIDTVDSAHVVTVLDPPAGTTNDLLLAGSAVLFDDALVVDSVVAVAGTIGARWVLDTSDSEVASVTGDFVDNTDPHNPVITFPTGTLIVGDFVSASQNFKTATSFTVVATAASKRFLPLMAYVEFTDVDTLTVGPTIEIGNNAGEDNVAPALAVANTAVTDDAVPFVMAVAPVIITLTSTPITGHCIVNATATTCTGRVHLIGLYVN